LRNLLRKYYNKVDGCFAVYESKDNWRFSYISETILAQGRWSSRGSGTPEDKREEVSN
jgi:hypothetical protein